MREQFRNTFTSLTAYMTNNHSWEPEGTKHIYIHLCAEKHALEESNIARQTSFICKRTAMPISLFNSIERACIDFVKSLNGKFVYGVDYDLITAHDDMTYDEFIQYRLNINGSNRSSRRRTSRKSCEYRTYTERGPYNWFVISPLNVAIIPKLTELIAYNMNQILRAAANNLPLSQTYYNRLVNHDQLVRERLIEAHRRREAFYEWIEYVRTIISRILYTRIGFV